MPFDPSTAQIVPQRRFDPSTAQPVPVAPPVDPSATNQNGVPTGQLPGDYRPPPPTEEEIRRSGLTQEASGRLEAREKATGASPSIIPGLNLGPLQDVITHGMTFGFERPLAAFSSALTPSEKYPDAGFLERYGAGERAFDANLDTSRSKLGEFAEPVETASGFVAGYPTGGSAAQPFLKSVGTGTALGAASGLAGSNEGSRVSDTILGAGSGAVTSAALSAVPAIAANKKTRQLMERPSSEDLFRSGRAGFNKLNESGATYSSNDVSQLQRDILADIKSRGYHPDLHPGTTTLLGELKNAATPTQPMKGSVPISEIDRIHQMGGGVQRSKNVNNLDDPMHAGTIRRNLDEFLGNVSPQQGTLAPDEALKIRKNAVEDWRRGHRTQDLEYRKENAQRNAETKGGSMEQHLQKDLANVAKRGKDPNRSTTYTDKELALIDKVARGTVPARLLSKGADIAHSAGRKIATIGTLQAGTAGELGMLGSGVGLFGLGSGLQGLANRSTRKGLTKLENLLATGNVKGPSKGEAFKKALIAKAREQGPTADVAALINAGIIPKEALLAGQRDRTEEKD